MRREHPPIETMRNGRELLPVDYGIENFIRNKNGRCLNSKTYFKYWIPKKTYDLFEVAWITKWDIEFFTLNHDYKEIWSEFRNSNKYGRCELNSIGYDENYKCYCVDILALEFLEHYMKEALSPFRYMGEDEYLEHAHSMGYTDDVEIKNDWIDYHNRIGSQFSELGLLPRGMLDEVKHDAIRKVRNDKLTLNDKGFKL